MCLESKLFDTSDVITQSVSLFRSEANFIVSEKQTKNYVAGSRRYHPGLLLVNFKAAIDNSRRNGSHELN
ncbi:hypothetical protein StoSoilB3_11360 [Arthrobacter sp. StoSoilB3]|nr:hypothetical protein StoSoilB3_11360 [Arthrobacter sp. StoSoilB3]